MRVHVGVQDLVPRQKKLLVNRRPHEGTAVKPQVIPEPQHVTAVTNACTDLLECDEVALHQRIKQTFDAVLINDEIAEEIVETAQEGPPLEKVAAADDDDRAVRFGPKPERTGAELVPEAGLGRMVWGGGFKDDSADCGLVTLIP